MRKKNDDELEAVNVVYENESIHRKIKNAFFIERIYLVFGYRFDVYGDDGRDCLLFAKNFFYQWKFGVQSRLYDGHFAELLFAGDARLVRKNDAAWLNKICAVVHSELHHSKCHRFYFFQLVGIARLV